MFENVRSLQFAHFVGFILLIIILLFLNSNYSRVQEQKVSIDENIVDLRQLLFVAQEVAKNGGAEVKRIRIQADLDQKSKGKTMEGADNPVTKGDLLSNRAMYETLNRYNPNLKITSEEHLDQLLDDVRPDPEFIDSISSKVRNMFFFSSQNYNPYIHKNRIDIWLDPLDATQEYTENLTEYVTTMVCVAVDGIPVIGVVYKPFKDEMLWSYHHGSVSKISHQLVDTLNYGKEYKLPTKIIVSRSHAGKIREFLSHELFQSPIITPAGGAGYKAWEVLMRREDIYMHTTFIKKWDICAPDALFRASGGKLTTLNDVDIDYSTFHLLHDENLISDPEVNKKGVLAVASREKHANYHTIIQHEPWVID